MYTILKFAITALIVVAASEVAKRSSVLGALIASLPLTSLLAICWLYFETRDTQKVAALSSEILWLVLPSLAFFVVFPLLLRMHISFTYSMLTALLVMLIAYFAMI